jgi:hypothetical protein
VKTIAISGWLAYAPLRAAEDELNSMGIRLLDRAADRGSGLSDGRFEAAMLSTYHLAALLDAVGDDFAVSWAFVEPVGDGSDRIVVRSSIKSITDLFQARIGICQEGLEHSLFEHLFYLADLAVKRDYIVLPDRSRYLVAFRDGRIDAVLAPQPDRSCILKEVADAEIFQVNGRLPRYGLYAVLVHRRSEWQPDELREVQRIIWAKAAILKTLTDEELRAVHPGSFTGIERPAHEIRSTLNWLSPTESANYLCGHGTNSFREHLRRLSEYRAHRFASSPLELERITALVADL